MALELFAKVLGANAEAQDQASQGETVDAGSLPSYTSQVSGNSAVQPFNGSVLGSGSNAGAAFGAITGAATGSGMGEPSAAPTSVTVTSPDGTVTTVGPGASADTGGAAGTTPMTTAPVTTTPISTTTTDGIISRDGGLTGLSSAELRSGDGNQWHTVGADGTGGGGGGQARWPRPAAAPAADSARARSTAAPASAPDAGSVSDSNSGRPRCTAARAPAGAPLARRR